MVGRPGDPNKPLNYRQDLRTGGYGLFTNMTAALQLDLTQTLCRYAIDPASGALKIDPTPDNCCGQPVHHRGTRSNTSGGTCGAPSSGGSSPLTPTLPKSAVGQKPSAQRSGGLIGVPAVPGGDPVITRQTKLQLIAFAALALLGMSYLGFNYVGLDRVLLGSGYDVAADFKDSGGIFVNAEVTYRGVAVGRVSDMKLVHDGVRVVFTIKPGAAPIPADTDALVATRSAVGEQYVILRPRTAKGPFLKDGSVIPQNRTAIPVPVEQLLLNLDKLAGSIDQEHLRVVVNELGTAFTGAGDDLGRLIDNGDLLLARAEGRCRRRSS